MENELVSIIVPIYNVEKYLDKCVESVVNQTYKSLEIILVDDGSPDNCPKMCDDWAKKDSRIKVIHKNNGGISKARNCGIDKATGEYLMFVDSDDWIDENTVEELYRIAKNENVDIVSYSLIKEYSENTVNNINDVKYCIYYKEEFYEKLIDDDNVAGFVWNKFFKRSLIGNQRFDSDLHCCEDLEFCSRVFMNCCKVAYTTCKFYHYRQRLDSITGNFDYNPKMLSLIKAYQKILPIFNEYDKKDVYKIERNLLKHNLNIKGRMKLSKVYDDEVLDMLNSNIEDLYRNVILNKNNSLMTKANIFITNLLPATSLRVKQMIIKNKRFKL